MVRHSGAERATPATAQFDPSAADPAANQLLAYGSSEQMAQCSDDGSPAEQGHPKGTGWCVDCVRQLHDMDAGGSALERSRTDQCRRKTTSSGAARGELGRPCGY